jgi:carbon storage regulator
VGESLVIDGSIIVQILDVRGSSIRIGIEAPEEVLIVRSELIGVPTESETALTID